MPNRFVFRLDRLLRLREMKEDARLRDLGLARGRSEEARETLESGERTREGAERETALHGGPGPLDLEALKGSWLGLEWARERVRRAGQNLDARRREEDLAREAYAAAGRDRTVLTHLRERKELEHVREIERWEQKLLDEAGARRR